MGGACDRGRRQHGRLHRAAAPRQLSGRLSRSHPGAGEAPGPGLRARVSPGLLRRLNFAAIPLVWQPLFLTEAQATHALEDSEDAQSRLLRSAFERDEDPEAVADAADLLRRITTIARWD